METKVLKRNRAKSQRLNLRMRINNQARNTKESIVTNLMNKHNLRDFDKGLMLYIRCLNDDKVRKQIEAVSQTYIH